MKLFEVKCFRKNDLKKKQALLDIQDMTDNLNYPIKLNRINVLLDTSGSMGWSFTQGKNVIGRYHTALTAAFAALHFALQKGAYVSCINFSDRVRSANGQTMHTQSSEFCLIIKDTGQFCQLNA